MLRFWGRVLLSALIENGADRLTLRSIAILGCVVGEDWCGGGDKWSWVVDRVGSRAWNLY